MARNHAGRGFFRGAMDAIIEARSRQVSRYVNGALLMLDDETLAKSGYTREELAKRGGSGYLF
jgi:hypothetical protein